MSNIEWYKKIEKLRGVDKEKAINDLNRRDTKGYSVYLADKLNNKLNEIEKRRDILEMLLDDIGTIRLTELNSHKDVDLSITIYTIKTIMNLVYGLSDFSDDPCISVNYNKYLENKTVRDCFRWWYSIWWDTDTGVLSKKEIEKRRYKHSLRDYHANANRMYTIINTYKKEIKNLMRKERVYSYYMELVKSGDINKATKLILNTRVPYLEFRDEEPYNKRFPKHFEDCNYVINAILRDNYFKLDDVIKSDLMNLIRCNRGEISIGTSNRGNYYLCPPELECKKELYEILGNRNKKRKK